RRAISRLGSPAAFILITSRTRRIASLSVGIQGPLRKAERVHPMGARRGLVTRATSSRNGWATSNRNGGRDHLGILGDIDRNPQHGTTTLFAALEVATGKILATHSKRRRRVEFLDFMDRVTAAFPNRQLHVILDNLSTHQRNEEWLEAHPNVKFHFTPTSASWLNQVEVWFSILQGQSLSGASFTSLKQLEQHIDAYIKAYNGKAEPFVWTKKKVRQHRFKGRRITQL